MKIALPELCLVLLIGTSGSGKSSFGRHHFKTTEVISSDFCRGLVADDENDQGASAAAFAVLHCILAQRLIAGRLTVVDATNVHPEDRKSLIDIAREHNCLSVAIVFDIDEKICQKRNESRADRKFGAHVIGRQNKALRRSLKGLRSEGFHRTFILSSVEQIDAVEIERVPLWNNRQSDHGPFDIIGDIHGCFDELLDLLGALGYEFENAGKVDCDASHPQGRRVVFVGDLVDRGPKTPDVTRLVMNMVASGHALCVAGNHDVKLMRKLLGKSVSMTHGLPESMQQLEGETEEFKQKLCKFLDGLISHYVFDEGKLVVAHAGLKEAFQGRSSARVRTFCLYGETTGETDEYGLPVRYNWAQDYRGRAAVVYGHTPVPEAVWLNNTICLDTACVFGGKLTALRYPERELVEVAARQTYYQPVKPISASLAQSAADDESLRIVDVTGKRIINTRLMHSITVRQENSAAALEIMSRFAINPRWLLYLPPTMSPCGTSKLEGLLEHPDEALAYFQTHGVNQIICEEKHMGSRAVVLVCKDAATAERRFGVKDEEAGACYTRTGRAFFSDSKLESELLQQLRDAASEADFWSEFQTDWFLLDAELMPWSVKAQELLRKQYAATGAAALQSTREASSLLQTAAERGLALGEIRDSYLRRQEAVSLYVDSYRRYCWEVKSIEDLKLAPFHLLATEGSAHFDKPHLWHLAALAKLAHANAEELVMQTAYKTVDLASSDDCLSAVAWWTELTSKGGEGMVIKPQDFIATGSKGFVQPAVKCRGKEYLRIIYGPDYDDERYLQRLRQRGLNTKRSLAMREFALGVESVERFVRKEPLYRVHEPVFAVLAMESEPVDPRL